MKLARRFIELRYELLLYFYTTFYQYSKYARPMIKSLIIYDTTDEEVKNRMDESIVGDHILDCPMLQPGVHERILYLPTGQWYNYWTGELSEGRKEIKVKADLTQMPIFIKAGAVIPKIPVMQYVGEKSIDTIDLHVYYSQDRVESELYFDALDGYECNDGAYQLSQFAVEVKNGQLSIGQTSTGDGYGHHHFKVIVHGLPYSSSKAIVDGDEIGFNKTLEVNRNFKNIELLK